MTGDAARMVPESPRSALPRRLPGLVAAPAVVLLALLVIVHARHGQPLGVDLDVRRLLSPYGQGTTGRLARFVTQFGAGPVLYALLGTLAALPEAARR